MLALWRDSTQHGQAEPARHRCSLQSVAGRVHREEAEPPVRLQVGGYHVFSNKADHVLSQDPVSSVQSDLPPARIFPGPRAHST